MAEHAVPAAPCRPAQQLPGWSYPAGREKPMESSEQIAPNLEAAQQALEQALDVACGADLSKVDTGELIRIEETLAIASKAAKEVVSVRLKRRSRRAPGKEAQDAPIPDDTIEVEAPIAHRIFEDVRGKRWHAFAVQATESMSDRAGLPEEFRQGWLAFESKDELRRVAPIPENWAELSTDELRLLCHNARSAPRRTHPLETGLENDQPRKS